MKTAKQPDRRPPHIIFMLVDDMGWNNAPWNGNDEIQRRMPYTTELSQSGIILDRHYSYKYCSPARSALLSGRLPIHVTQNNKNNLVTNPGGADLRMTLLPQRLKEVGRYSTALVGKWHVGARSKANLPTSRGFDHYFGYLKGAEHYFTQSTTDEDDVEFVDLWSSELGGPAYGQNGTYSTFMYAREAERLVERHAEESSKDNERPLFLYLAWQAMHGPLEAPVEYELPLPNDPREARAKMNAMAAVLDEGIRNVTNALKRTGLYDNALIVVSSDNGGWIQLDHGGNNYPLRGGKVTDYEGGVRTAAFLTGGFLTRKAPHKVGTRSTLLVHIVDWYSTLIGLSAREDNQPHALHVPHNDTDSKRANGIPSIDSQDFWGALIGKASTVTTVREEIPLSFCNIEAECDWPGGVGDAALISWPYKIINGTQAGLGVWQGNQFPNASERIPMPGNDAGCPLGCLFNIRDDPTEHHDIKEVYPDIFNTLLKRLNEEGSKSTKPTILGETTLAFLLRQRVNVTKVFLHPDAVPGQ
eukprot:CAMPEP_0197436048 /NCGR_PEP_ID=MMETSP1175-20131217/3518_1 /TAXON_ID=1003142 /ORGANISM="Triceratium dubium, Strain CCMP147" /LENGTH=528 /DNA_ID=CAMNT_0042965229 /DNA_START=513 /DNA_END=2100 /DNA_ORIENTATION=+